jgi:hypothetical protein
LLLVVQSRMLPQDIAAAWLGNREPSQPAAKLMHVEACLLMPLTLFSRCMDAPLCICPVHAILYQSGMAETV